MLSILTCMSIGAFAQYKINGTVKNATNRETLTGATVQIESSLKGVYSDKDGFFTLSGIKKGETKLRISFIGFRDTLICFTMKADTSINPVLIPTAIEAGAITISATRVNESSPTTFTNLNKQQMSERNTGQDMPYLLTNSPSVVVTSDAGAGVGYTGMRIRGTDGTRINVTVNGIPVNDAESSGTYWVDFPDLASSVDNIQIQRGVGSSTNGAGAFGASLNIQTDALNDKPYAEINSSAGSFNTWKNTVSAGTGLLSKHFTFDARLSKLYSDGYIDRAFSDLKSFYLSGGYYGKKDVIRFVTFSGQEVTYQAWYGVPKDSLKTNRTYNPYTYANQTDNYLQNNYQLFYTHEFNKKLNANVALHYTKGAGYYEEYREADDLQHYGIDTVFAGSDTVTTSDLIRRRWLDNDFYGTVWSFNYSDFKKISITLGGAYNEYFGDHYGEVIWARFAGNSEINSKYYANTGEKKDFNTFLKCTYNIGKKLSLSGDVQFRHINYSFYGFDNDLRNFDEKVMLNFLNPKAGISYEINNYNNVYTSFAVANKEPNRDDYTQSEPGKYPKQETLYDLETGYRHRSKKFSSQVNLYYMSYKNQLVLTGEINDVGAYNRTNIPESYRAGIELEGKYKPFSKFSVGANLTLSRNRIKNFKAFIDDWDTWLQDSITYSETDIAFSPDITGGFFVEYEPFKGLFLSTTSRYVGKQYLDNTFNASRMIDPYCVNDIRISYAFSTKKIKEVSISFQLMNFLNTMYVSNGWTYSYKSGGENYNDNYYYPQAGRNCMAGVTLKF
ncbi:MAG: TonB-dependent receptor [Bacteroidota bacterium]